MKGRVQFSSRCLFDLTGKRGGDPHVPLGIAPGAVHCMQGIILHTLYVSRGWYHGTEPNEWVFGLHLHQKPVQTLSFT